MPLAVRRLAHLSPDYDAAVSLRRAILRTPLGLDFTAEQLAAEAEDIHLALWSDDDLVGTVILAPYQPGVLKLRQMAISADHRGEGLGAHLLTAAEDIARTEGASRIVLAARITARDFYARYGYAVEGDNYIEVTIPHVTMWKDL